MIAVFLSTHMTNIRIGYGHQCIVQPISLTASHCHTTFYLNEELNQWVSHKKHNAR